MFLFLFLALPCVSFASEFLDLPSVPVYNYNVTVQTATNPSFTKQEGILKLYINYTSIFEQISKEIVLLTPKAVELERDASYTSNINSYTPLNSMTGIILRWTLNTPFDPKYLVEKPIIYFEKVSITARFYDPHYKAFLASSRTFCPKTRPVGIKHSEGASFYPCQNSDLDDDEDFIID